MRKGIGRRGVGMFLCGIALKRLQAVQTENLDLEYLDSYARAPDATPDPTFAKATLTVQTHTRRLSRGERIDAYSPARRVA